MAVTENRKRNSRNFRARRRVIKYGVDPLNGGPDNRHLWSLHAANDVASLKPLDWAYFAGIMDGEGSISCHRPGITSHYEISIGTTAPELLSWLLEHFPFGTLVIRSPVLNSAGTGLRKQQYEFKIRGALTLIEVLEQTFPYLTIKRERAAEVLCILLSLYAPYRHMITLPARLRPSKSG